MSRCGGDEAATRFETSRSPAPSLAAGMQMDKPLTKSGASELQVLASEGFVGDIIYICAFVPLGVLAFWRLELSSRFTVYCYGYNVLDGQVPDSFQFVD